MIMGQELTQLDNLELANETHQRFVAVSNNLLDTLYKLSLPEQRIMWYVMRNYNIGDDFEPHCYVYHNEYASLFSMSASQAALEVSRACIRLTNNSVFVPQPQNDQNIDTTLAKKIFSKEEMAELKPFRIVNFVESCDYGIAHNTSRVILTNSMLRLLIPLKEYFTKVHIYDVKHLSNANHVGLYQRLKRWINKGKYVTSPTRLANDMLLPKTYEAYSQMRRGFLTPAIEKINERTDINIHMDEIREDDNDPRSKVVELKFTISRKEEVINTSPEEEQHA